MFLYDPSKFSIAQEAHQNNTPLNRRRGEHSVPADRHSEGQGGRQTSEQKLEWKAEG